MSECCSVVLCTLPPPNIMKKNTIAVKIELESNLKVINQLYYLRMTLLARVTYGYYCINTVVIDLTVSSIQKIEQFYYGKTMVHFCKGCDVHVLKIEAFKNERLSVYLY